MAKDQYQPAPVPATKSLPKIKEAAKTCTACPLYKNATQTVFGNGPLGADIMIVGEQPGNEEDLAGLAFVGPAGAILDKALEAAGLNRKQVYLTNAVKHFKFEPRGKVRLHKKPNVREMQACLPWLVAEVTRVKPKVILALGSTAGTSVLGRLPKIGVERGKIQKSNRFAEKVMVSWHPSAILRSITPKDRAERMKQLTQDIKAAVKAAQQKP